MLVYIYKIKGNREATNRNNKAMYTYSNLSLHTLVKVTSESRALTLEGREFHNLPVGYSKDFR